MLGASCSFLRSPPPEPSAEAAFAPPPACWAPHVAAVKGHDDGSGAADDFTLPLLPPLSARDALRNARCHVVDTLLDVYAAFLAFVTQLITAETVLVSAVAVAAVYAFTRWFSDSVDANGRPRRLVANLQWTIFATVVVFPLTFALNESWRRRETALQALAELKASLLSLYLGHRDICTAPLPAGHLQQLQGELCVLCRAMCEVLEAPTVSHSRHVLTAAGRRKHVTVSAAKRRLHARITLSFGALSAASRATLSGAAPGAANSSRLAQYAHDLIASWELLRAIKSYRTPQTTRAYAHVAVWAHPFIMGPYYSWVALGGPRGGTEAAGLAFAIFLAVATSVALSALLNARIALEDPFVPGLLDTIRVGKELGLVQQNLAAFAAMSGDAPLAAPNGDSAHAGRGAGAEAGTDRELRVMVNDCA